jgi:hypothetical protein
MPTSSTGSSETRRAVAEARRDAVEEERRLGRIEHQQELARVQVDAGIREIKDLVTATATTLRGDIGRIQAVVDSNTARLGQIEKDRSDRDTGPRFVRSRKSDSQFTRFSQ